MRPLTSPFALNQQYPITSEQKHFIEQSRAEVTEILKGNDPRLLLIVGPCSIHDVASAKEYADHLCRLKDQVSSQFLILMRVYFEKPRTLAGWKGMTYDPFLNGSHDIETGLAISRQLLIDLAEMEIPAATEFLDPLVKPYLEDLITWGSIGARTSTSQIHRQMASSLCMPVGMKNPITGTLDGAIQSVVAATQPHTLIGVNEQGLSAIIQSKGNPDAHLVLRGWDRHPNHDPHSIDNALTKLQHAELPPRLLVDCSHDNSNKKHELQVAVFQQVVDQILAGNTAIRGLLLESNLFAGNQNLSNGSSALEYGVSITDPCLDWETTKNLILEEAKRFEQMNVPATTIITSIR